MKKMTLYHWSTHVVTEPRIKGICGYGFYLAKNKKYSRACGDMLHKVVVCPQNTLVFNDAEVKKNAFFNIDKQHYDNYISQGYDSLAWYKNGVLCEFIALVPEIIKNIEFLGSRISESKLFILKNNTNKGKNTMNTPQRVKINEAQLKQIVAESVKRILAENEFNENDMEEGFFGNMRDKIGAVGDTFKKGGNYAAHFNNRQLQRVRGDIESLKGKYGVQNSQNGQQYVAHNSQNAIETINAKYDRKIQALEQQRQAEIEKATGKVQKQWNRYQTKKGALDQTRNQAYQRRRAAMNANPYADFPKE